jgi:hypothetical protein
MNTIIEKEEIQDLSNNQISDKIIDIDWTKYRELWDNVYVTTEKIKAEIIHVFKWKARVIPWIKNPEDIVFIDADNWVIKWIRYRN